MLFSLLSLPLSLFSFSCLLPSLNLPSFVPSSVYNVFSFKPKQLSLQILVGRGLSRVSKSGLSAWSFTKSNKGEILLEWILSVEVRLTGGISYIFFSLRSKGKLCSVTWLKLLPTSCTVNINRICVPAGVNMMGSLSFLREYYCWRGWLRDKGEKWQFEGTTQSGMVIWRGITDKI